MNGDDDRDRKNHRQIWFLRLVPTEMRWQFEVQCVALRDEACAPFRLRTGFDLGIDLGFVQIQWGQQLRQVSLRCCFHVNPPMRVVLLSRYPGVSTCLRPAAGWKELRFSASKGA